MASISKTETQDGQRRWRARWRGPDGRQHERWFPTKVRAERFLAEVEVGGHQDPKAAAAAVGFLLSGWLDSNTVRLAPKTASSYRSLARLLTASLGARKVGMLSGSEIQKQVASWQRSGLSASRIRQAVRLLSQVCEQAVHDGVLLRNPCGGVKLPAMPTAQAKGLSPGEADALVARMPERWQLLGQFLNITGVRWAEAAGLVWGQVELKRRRVIIDRSLSQVDGRLIPRGTKSGRSRVVPIPRDLAEALAGVTNVPPDGYVFTMPEGGPLRYDNWYARVWAPLKAGVGIHAFRRAAVTRLLEQGTPPHLVQAIVGHTDPKLTMAVYAAVNDTSLDLVWGSGGVAAGSETHRPRRNTG